MSATWERLTGAEARTRTTRSFRHTTQGEMQSTQDANWCGKQATDGEVPENSGVVRVWRCRWSEARQ